MKSRLLNTLEGSANHRGLIVAREDALLSALETSHDELAASLAALENACAIEVLSPLPFLVARFPKWSNSQAPYNTLVSGSRPDSASLEEGPVSEHAAAAAALKQEVGGAGEGESLLAEITAALDETDPSEFRAIAAGYPAAVIRQALRRVALTPSSQIRKSKAALFRYLLAKLA